jgi:hypothetical protein
MLTWLSPHALLCSRQLVLDTYGWPNIRIVNDMASGSAYPPVRAWRADCFAEIASRVLQVE